MWDEVEVEVEVGVEASRGSHDRQLRPRQFSSRIKMASARLGTETRWTGMVFLCGWKTE